MHFYNIIETLSRQHHIVLFIDMDGVIAAYDFGRKFDFDKKRPLLHHLDVLEKISHLEQVELYILSISPKEEQIEEKQRWLDQYASFFPKDHRIILAKPQYPGLSSKEIKAEFLKQFQAPDKVAFIDDDNAVLKYIHHLLPHVLLYQDSELVD